jgi:hypothetical protein
MCGMDELNLIRRLKSDGFENYQQLLSFENVNFFKGFAHGMLKLQPS